MYRKDEIVLVKSPITYLRYILDYDNIQIYEYQSSTQTDLYLLERVYTLSISLFNTQYAVDSDKSAVFVAPSLVGKYIHIVYYTEGTQNPFYASSNLHQFITQVLKWTSNRVSEGIYILKGQCTDEGSYTIQPGSLVYDGQFMGYQGEALFIGNIAPPTIKETLRCYYFYINKDIINSYLIRNLNILQQIGMLTSASGHTDYDTAKLDVLTQYSNRYTSEPIKIAFMYVMLTSEYKYEVWIEYPSESRTL